MTVADLVHGDRPWRLACTWAATARQRGLVAALAVAALLARVLPAPARYVPLLAVPALWVAVLRLPAPTVWLEGGGRRPLLAGEVVGWLAHLGLKTDEQEAAAREAKAKAAVRR